MDQKIGQEITKPKQCCCSKFWQHGSAPRTSLGFPELPPMILPDDKCSYSQTPPKHLSLSVHLISTRRCGQLRSAPRDRQGYFESRPGTQKSSCQAFPADQVKLMAPTSKPE